MRQFRGSDNLSTTPTRSVEQIRHDELFPVKVVTWEPRPQSIFVPVFCAVLLALLVFSSLMSIGFYLLILR